MHRFTDNKVYRDVMVHGAGIQVVVIRVFQVVSQPAWNVATAARCKIMCTPCVRTFLQKLWEFMGWSKWQ